MDIQQDQMWSKPVSWLSSLKYRLLNSPLCWPSTVGKTWGHRLTTWLSTSSSQKKKTFPTPSNTDSGSSLKPDYSTTSYGWNHKLQKSLLSWGRRIYVWGMREPDFAHTVSAETCAPSALVIQTSEFKGLWEEKHSAPKQVCTPVSHSHNRSCTELPWILWKQPLEDTTGGTVFTGLSKSGPLSLYNIPQLSPLCMSGGINKTVPLGGDTTDTAVPNLPNWFKMTARRLN